MEKRLTDSIETAISLTGDVLMIEIINGEILNFSLSYACDDCEISLQEPAPRNFSFNNPYGACPCCDGLGELSKIDPDLIVTDENLSLLEGAIYANGWVSPNLGETMANMYYRGLANHYGFDLNTPFTNKVLLSALGVSVLSIILLVCTPLSGIFALGGITFGKLILAMLLVIIIFKMKI